jgi:hypothetical protein
MTIEQFEIMQNAWMALKISIVLVLISFAFMVVILKRRADTDDLSKKGVEERVRHFIESNPEIFGWWIRLPKKMRRDMEKDIINRMVLFEKILSK